MWCSTSQCQPSQLPAGTHWDTLGANHGSFPFPLPRSQCPGVTLSHQQSHRRGFGREQAQVLIVQLWEKKKKNQRNFLIRAGLGTKRVCPSRAGNVTFAGSWCQTGAAGERRCLAGLGASVGPTLTQQPQFLLWGPACVGMAGRGTGRWQLSLCHRFCCPKLAALSCPALECGSSSRGCPQGQPAL